MAQTLYQPTASQWASATVHLENRIEHVRINGERFAIVASGNSGKVYRLPADASFCHCIWWERTRTRCSHMLSVELAALEDELIAEHQIDEAIAAGEALAAAYAPPITVLRPRYADLFPECTSNGCHEISESRSGLCDRCASDLELAERRESQRLAVAAGA